MIYKGTLPPWEGATEYGSWERVAPEEGFFAEPSSRAQWRWIPPRAKTGSLIHSMSEILKNVYTPAIKAQLDSPSAFLKVLEEELGVLKGRPEREARARLREAQRALRKVVGR